jgi:hypothetical protein
VGDACPIGALVRRIAKGGAPPEEHLRFDLTPIDWAARAMVALARRARTCSVFHLAGPRPVSLAELLDAMRAEDISVRPGPPAMRDLFLATDVTFDTTETTRALPDLPCPEADRALLADVVRRALAEVR